MIKSDNIAELAKALCKAQAELENAQKSADNPFFKSKYADLAEVLRCVKPVATSNGLSFTQMPSYADNVVSVETMLMHESGEFITSICSSPAPKLDPQGIGSAITYLRRYSLSAVFGLAQEDDDGNSQQIGQEPEKPWFNDFDNMKPKFLASIQSGERTAKQIYDNLSQSHKISKEVKKQILELK